MTVSSLLDSAGRRRSPATLPGFHSRRAPRNKGMLYPADPPTVEEMVCVMRHASEDPHGFRLRAMIVMLWRGGLRVQEALALSEHDLDPQRGSVLVRCGKGGRRREVGMAERDPAPARPRQPRHHEHLPPGIEHRGDHLHRARAPSAYDVGDGRPPTLKGRTPEGARADACARASGSNRECCFAARKRSSEYVRAGLPPALAGRPMRQSLTRDSERLLFAESTSRRSRAEGARTARSPEQAEPGGCREENGGRQWPGCRAMSARPGLRGRSRLRWRRLRRRARPRPPW
jgi:hypothetical protein